MDTYATKCEEISGMDYMQKQNNIIITTNTDELQILELEIEKVDGL